jgi:very-short-patch-repair endonuclease
LRFRSESEVRIAQALDKANVMFLPNCRARIGSRTDTRKGLEVDFIIMSDGKWGVLEVDGAPWHPPTRAAQDHQRDRPLKYHGAAVVERFEADECFENPDGVVHQFLSLLVAR